MVTGKLSILLFVAFVNSGLVPDNVIVTWGDWTDCTVTCGGSGIQTRTKFCDSGSGPVQCDVITNPCGGIICSNIRAGSVWSECSVSCGGGTRSRTFTTSSGLSEDIISCNMQECGVERYCPSDFTFILDASGSIGELNWWKQKQFVIDYLRSMKISYDMTRIGFVTYGGVSLLNFDLTTYGDKQLMIDHIWNIDYMNSMTNTASGLLAMHDMVQNTRRSSLKQLAILITDGHSNTDVVNTIPNADAAKADDITIIVLGIKNYNPTEILAISSGPDYVATVATFSGLHSILVDITDITCASTGHNTDCTRCDLVDGLIHQPDTQNCHMYYMCQKTSNGSYITYQMSCGVLYWDQDIRTCMPSIPAEPNCDMNGLPVTTISPTTTESAPCPLIAHSSDPTKYYNGGVLMVCSGGTTFMAEKCACDGIVVPNDCEKDLLLDFPFDTHFNDVTCTKAQSSLVGTGTVTLVNDNQRGMVASFDTAYLTVPYLNNYFANNLVQDFSVCLYYKFPTTDGDNHVMVSNGDCNTDPSFEIGLNGDTGSSMTAYGSIETSTGSGMNAVPGISKKKWHHACWVYNGSVMKFYSDKVEQGSPLPITGGLANTPSDLAIGSRCGDHYFHGYLDDVKLWARAITQSEINAL